MHLCIWPGQPPKPWDPEYARHAWPWRTRTYTRVRTYTYGEILARTYDAHNPRAPDIMMILFAIAKVHLLALLLLRPLDHGVVLNLFVGFIRQGGACAQAL